MREFSKSLVMLLGSFLVLVGIILISYKQVNKYIENKNEDMIIDEFYNQQQEKIKNEKISKIEEKLDIKNDNKEKQIKYIAVLKISKINLIRGLVEKSSHLNNIKYNVQILNESDMPDFINGNVILASHSGTAKISYFRNLYKLEIGDTATIDYRNKTYTYEVYKKYEVNKVGNVSIKKDFKESSLILITCVSGTEKQLVTILKLLNIK